MAKKEQKRPLLDEHLIAAMQSIDSQIAREMQRTPQEVSKHGVQKWDAYAKRVEMVTGVLLDGLGDQEVELDSLLVLAQATTKALSLTIQDLERKGLGQLRTDYCIQAIKAIESDCYRGSEILKDAPELM